jgi:Ca-activated chloride channel family protein
MSWAQPLWWFALLGVLALAAIALLAGRRHQRRLGELFRGAVLEKVLPRAVRLRRALRDALALASLALVVVALVEPRYGKEVQQVRSRGVDIAIAVDLSRSMDARDVDPSRLERARRELLDLLDLLGTDRVGLVIYAGGAFPRLPLTQDHDAVRLVVEELSTDMFQAQGSELGEALRVATRLLTSSDRPTGRAILVLSDGEVHEPQDALAAAREAADAGVRVYALGIGREPAPIPLASGGLLTEGGQTVLSDPDPAVLEDVARITGGAFATSVPSNADVRQLVETEIRGSLQAAVSATMSHETWRTGFQWPLGLAVLLGLASAWLGEGRRRWGAAVALWLAVSGAARAGDLAEADRLYRDGSYRQAVDVLTELSMERPGDAEVWERLGAAAYRAGDPDAAARAFDTAVALGEGTGAEFNAGNAHYLAGRLEEALARYERVLAEDPDHAGATQNRDLLVNELEARRRLQPPPPPQPQEGQGEEGEPQDGQEGEEGQQSEPGQDPQPGQGQPQAGEGQPGEGGAPQSGDPRDGQAESGDPGEGEQRPGEPQDGQGSRDPAAGDQALEREQDHGAADLSEGSGEGEADERAAGADGGGEGEEDAGPVTRTQAERLLDGVEEGRPRVRIPGGGSGKPW